jgi:hypothetical protein
LWLEYVRNKKGGQNTYWLMWYDDEGTPKLPMSGVISENELKTMTSRLTEFINLQGN